MTKTLITSFLLSLFFIFFNSCKELDYFDGITPFGEVYFDLTKTANSNFIKVKYNGHPIEVKEGTAGQYRVPEGEGKFEFYDIRNGKTLLEKNVLVNSLSVQKFTLFQPSAEDQIVFLDPEGEMKEPDSPVGFMKIKLANYSKSLVPFDKTDIIINFRYLKGRQYFYEPVDTIQSIGQTLDTATYRLVKMGQRLPNYQTGYYCSFKEHGSENEVKNAGGSMYYSHIAIIPDEGGRNVFTRFLKPVEYIANNLYIMNNNIYYYIDLAKVYDN